MVRVFAVVHDHKLADGNLFDEEAVAAAGSDADGERCVIPVRGRELAEDRHELGELFHVLLDAVSAREGTLYAGAEMLVVVAASGDELFD
jgi:hypothetical protein